MVLPLRPSKFYGRSLPRPRIYNDLKFNSERVDPPMGVTAPLLSWAKDAHWSMGGLSHKRKRMHGKIDGNAKKLRTMDDKVETITADKTKKNKNEGNEKTEENRNASSDLGTPEVEYSSPTPAQIFMHKSVHYDDVCSDDVPLVVPDSTKKSAKKRSPKVRIRARNLDDIFRKQALATPLRKRVKAVSSERYKLHSVVQSGLKKQARQVMQVYDFVEEPVKIMQIRPRRTSPRKTKDKVDTVVESLSPKASEGQVKRSLSSVF